MAAPISEKIDILFDTDTGDPDDFFALCVLAGHPRVHVRAVTVTPGTRGQVGSLRAALRRLELADIPVGARDPDHDKDCVSGFLRKALGKPRDAAPDGLGHEVLAGALQQWPHAIVVTGAPVHNLALLLQEHEDLSLDRWVAQGGFAGDSVVPPEHRLTKFAGRETCSTFNFGGGSEAALTALGSDRIARRDLVSKNVCHDVWYDPAIHERLRQVRDTNPGKRLLFDTMEQYLRKHKQGKLFHDPLATCVAIDPSIAELREVEIYRENREWGSRLAQGTNTFITVAIDKQRFWDVLLEG